MNYKFPKTEKLKLKRDIEKLFKEGKKYFCHPLSLKYIHVENIENNKCGVSVPKRVIKKAVDRNRIKRQMREAYRLNKHILDDNNTKYLLMFVYSKNEKIDYAIIEKAVIKLLKRLS
jgi:ribonuclease P protein component